MKEMGRLTKRAFILKPWPKLPFLLCGDNAAIYITFTRPERWLRGESELDAKTKAFSSLPWGHGNSKEQDYEMQSLMNLVHSIFGKRYLFCLSMPFFSIYSERCSNVHRTSHGRTGNLYHSLQDSWNLQGNICAGNSDNSERYQNPDLILIDVMF